MDDPNPCLVTRLPGAPPRRGGRVWPLGETTATLTAAEVAAVAGDPGYLLVAPAPRKPKRGQTDE